jgi:ubiquinone/menaquinone biosynthesis C-methylase UbiE
MTIYQILEMPIIYKTAQAILAPGMKQIVTEQLRQAVQDVPAGARTLDVGCGPASWLSYLGMQPVGLDLSHSYTMQYHAAGGTCVTASASEIPFAANSFDLVLCVALLHHLPEEVARKTVSEMVRVARPGAKLVVFDPVLPASPLVRPVAYGLCKLDRGKFIRKQADLRSRVLAPFGWDVRRITHSYIGTEGVIGTLRKN